MISKKDSIYLEGLLKKYEKTKIHQNCEYLRVFQFFDVGNSSIIQATSIRSILATFFSFFYVLSENWLREISCVVCRLKKLKKKLMI